MIPSGHVRECQECENAGGNCVQARDHRYPYPDRKAAMFLNGGE